MWLTLLSPLLFFATMAVVVKVDVGLVTFFVFFLVILNILACSNTLPIQEYFIFTPLLILMPNNGIRKRFTFLSASHQNYYDSSYMFIANSATIQFFSMFMTYFENGAKAHNFLTYFEMEQFPISFMTFFGKMYHPWVGAELLP